MFYGIHTGTRGLQEAESFADITFGSTLALGGTSHPLDIVYRAQRLACFLPGFAGDLLSP